MQGMSGMGSVKKQGGMPSMGKPAKIKAPKLKIPKNSGGAGAFGMKGSGWKNKTHEHMR